MTASEASMLLHAIAAVAGTICETHGDAITELRTQELARTGHSTSLDCEDDVVP